MEEIKWFDINEKTKPSFETDKAKWYLLKKGKKYACWRWDSKEDERDRMFLLTTLKGDKVVKECYQIETLFDVFYLLEKVDGENS